MIHITPEQYWDMAVMAAKYDGGVGEIEYELRPNVLFHFRVFVETGSYVEKENNAIVITDVDCHVIEFDEKVYIDDEDNQEETDFDEDTLVENIENYFL